MTRSRTVCFLLAATFLILPLSPSVAQNGESVFDEIRREHEWVEKHAHVRVPAPAEFAIQALAPEQQPIDVKHYKLQINLEPDPPAISGAVTITAVTTGPTDRIRIDANDNLEVTTVRFDDVKEFSQKKRSQEVVFNSTLPAGREFTIGVDYRGTPEISDVLGGGMFISKHGDDDVTVMATLSEPFAARAWWPCIDDPTDKATIEIEATAPEGYQVASNGVLQKVESRSAGFNTFFWREDSPIATYLVSVAAADYVKFEDSYTAMDGVTRMPLVYYVYPEHEAIARQKFAVTRRAMEIFAPLFGEYPFLNEKYGMAAFPWSGGMEHQTMTSLGASVIASERSTSQGIIAHELAHQWWGDLVTMRSWNDIWLNEGFATYSEVLFFEKFLHIDAGQIMRQSYDDGEVFGRLGGTVHAENADDPFDDTGAIYTKGAWVLHMLRHLLGDEKFFEALRDYAGRHGFSNAGTRDFQAVAEQYYGASLDWFFQQWVYAEGRPSYKVSSEISGADAEGNYSIRLTIKQKQSHQISGRDSSVYIMPLDVTIHYADGSRETRKVFNDKRKQSFTLAASKRPTSVGLDEGNWVLKKLKG
jgi:aminopeptidase N